ncbi:MAG: DUF2269 family protein [Vulcanimicrobiaceae bacterium]
MMGFLLVKFFHVLFAIVAIGANISYGVWFARAAKNPQSAVVLLRGVQFIDNYIANPAYILMLPTGIIMIRLGGYSFASHWISWAMGLWVIAMVVAYALYTPTLRKMIEAVAAGGINSPAANALNNRGRVLAAILGILVLAILVLMIFKPA